MPRLNVFDGGLNTRLDPTLIDPVQSVVCNNVDTSSGSLKSAKGLLLTGTAVGKYAYYFNDEWVSSDDAREYFEYQDVLYWTAKNATPQKYDGTTTRKLGIQYPGNVRPTATEDAAGDLSGAYRYCYTYYNVDDGTESRPSLLSSQIIVVDKQIVISDLVASSDPQVTHIKIYRIGGTSADFYEIGEVDNGVTTFTDNTADLDILGGLLDTEDNNDPPDGLRYLTKTQGRFFGAIGSKLRYDRGIGNPNYWPATNYIDFPENITAIAALYTGLVVFTKYTTWFVSGSLSAHLISYGQGCRTFESVISVGKSVYFTSTDGICVTQGSQVEVVSRDRLGKVNFNVTSSEVHDEVAYFSLDDNTTVVFDMRHTPNFRYFSYPVERYIKANDVLYAWNSDTGKLSKVFASTSDLEYAYTTGKLLVTGATNLKLFNNIYIHADGEHRVSIIVDDEIVATLDLDGTQTVYDITMPQDKQQGYTIQLAMSGRGTIHEIEFTAVGRQNGR